MNNASIFIITYSLLLLIYLIPKEIINVQLVQKADYFEMFFGSLLIIFLFGYFQYLITDDLSYFDFSFKLATLYIRWYYLWKFITNYVNIDNNYNVRF